MQLNGCRTHNREAFKRALCELLCIRCNSATVYTSTTCMNLYITSPSSAHSRVCDRLRVEKMLTTVLSLLVCVVYVPRLTYGVDCSRARPSGDDCTTALIECPLYTSRDEDGEFVGLIQNSKSK